MIQWKWEPTWGELLHTEVLKGPERTEWEDAAEVGSAEQEKKKRQTKAAAEG